MSRTNDDEQWEDLVRRLGGEPEDSALDPSSYFSAPPPGPRDYHVTEEVSEDFQPPSPKPIATGNPRTILSWTAVLGSVVIWLSTALLGISLAWWLAAATVMCFLAGVVSLFFLLPRSPDHRDPDDSDDYGSGAKL